MPAWLLTVRSCCRNKRNRLPEAIASLPRCVGFGIEARLDTEVGLKRWQEWLDPARLRDDYVPRGYHLRPSPLKGHEFGLKLSRDDRQALLSFLRTL
jgi:hypothetical protein